MKACLPRRPACFLSDSAEAPSEGIDRFGVWWGAMTPPGAPPVWVSPGDPEVDEGAELAVPLLATDADDDDLQFGALVLPEGAALDLASEPVRLVWTPGFEQAGKHDVVLTVTDGGRIVRLRFEVTVVNVDRPPTLADPGDLRVRERQRLTFTLDGADPDGDRLTFTGEPLPPGATLGADTGRFTWTPSAGQSGDHPVTFTVSAGGLLAERDATIIVAGVNGPPVLTPPANVELDEGERLTVVVEAADPDGDDVRLLFDPMPVGALFDDVSRRFEWLTGFEQEGVYPIAITATDGSLSDEHIWHVTVRDVNRPPVFAAVADQHLEEGQQMLFFAEAVDPDGDEVALSAEQLPGLAQFNADTGACMWDAGFGAAGEWMVVLGASDGQELSLLRVPVTIDDVNRAPVLQPLGTVAAAEGSPVEIGIDAEDPDGDAVALAARDLPAGAQLDGEAGWILWTPTFEQAGRHLVTVQASDGDLSDETLLVLDVADTNRAPEIEVAPVLVAEEGVALVAAVRASDPDGDLVQLSAEDLPPGAQLSVDGALTWTPSFDDAGDHGIVVVASDGDLSARAPVTLRVDDVDRPPTLAPLPDLRAAEGEELVVPVEAGDPDGDALELSLVDAPQGMAVDGAALRWTPGFEQAGAHAVTVRVAAGGADAEASFTVTVADVDRPPTLEITGDPAQGREGELLELTLVGVDPDGEAVSYGASLLPSGAVLAAADGRLSWTPAFDQAGTHPAVLLALAGGAVTALNVELTVADVDRPPTVRIEGPLKGVEAAPLELRVVAEDPDGGELTVTSPGLPRGAELDGRVIRWTPDYDQAGEHRIRAVAADAAGEAEAEVTLVIDNVNRQPEVVSPDDVSGREDDAVRVALTASDPDGDELTFRAGGLPSQARLHRTLGTITWHPGFDDAGDYSVEITVSDGTLSAHGGFELSIADVNRPPEVSAPTVHHVQAGATLVFTAVASDPDGDTLTLSAVPLPPGASMDGSKGVFRWTPAAADAGQVKLTVTASDGRLTATQDVTVFVSKGGEGGCATASGSATPLAAALWPGVLWRR